MFPSYLNVGCSETVNNERAAAYASLHGTNIQCDRCPGLPSALGHDPYTTPEQDDAPWFDPVRPESVDFLGVIGGSVEGLSGSTATREVTPLVGDGGSIGTLRRASREISWTVTALAISECGLSYGMEWLSRSLIGDPCLTGCTGQQIDLYSCCPGEIPELGFGDRELRHLFDVGLLEGPTITQRETFESIIWATVTFTLVAGVPWVYGEPLLVTDNPEGWVDLSQGEPRRADPDQVFQRCLPPVPCAQDPLCPNPILPPQPPQPASPCFATGVGNFRVSRVRVAPEDVPLWSQLVPVVEVQPGANIRRFLTRFWYNPLGSECDPDELDPCDSCGDANVTFLPAQSRLVIDGRTQRSVIECETQERGMFTAPPDLLGAEGGLFEFPFFPCPGGLCVEFWALDDPDQGSMASGRARVQLIPRADVV